MHSSSNPLPAWPTLPHPSSCSGRWRMMPPPCHDTATHFTVCYFIYFGPWTSLYRKFLCGHTDRKHKQAKNKQAHAMLLPIIFFCNSTFATITSTLQIISFFR
jgi:hypothetical protein